MKKLFALLFATSLAFTGCVTAPNGGGTTIDPVKLQRIKDAIVPNLSTVLLQVLRNSPQHAVEIGNYARVVGRVFVRIQADKTFAPSVVINALNDATAGLQANVPIEIIAGKNVLVSVYELAFDDKLTVAVPDNGWMVAVSDIVIGVIDQTLKDAGQPGIVNGQ